ncbi:solute carrier organic anion transporter family member 1C1-like, partial [Salvelinus alpinus]
LTACLQTITLLGPMFGFLLGSLCARLYVDIGSVDLVKIITDCEHHPKDARWVGTGWLGFLVSSVIMLLSGRERRASCLPAPLLRMGQGTSPHIRPSSGFIPSLKKLLSTPAYLLLLCGSILKFNSFIGLLMFKAKYMEQQFGQSAARANFLIVLPAIFSVPQECNRDCSCLAGEWDPVCSDNGITYTSPCLAGCSSFTGYGKNTVPILLMY